MGALRGAAVFVLLVGSTAAPGIDFADPGWQWRLPGESSPAVSFVHFTVDTRRRLPGGEVRVAPDAVQAIERQKRELRLRVPRARSA